VAFEHLKVKPLQRATSAWANAVVDALNQLYGNYQEVYRRGTAEDPWEMFYGGYGFFENNLFVQGKPVIKDGDPINLYDIFEPAKQRITQAIDQSLLTQYTRESRDVLSQVRFDEYGRVKVASVIDYISEATKQRLAQAVDQSLLTQYMRESRDVVVRLSMDEYGRVGVIITQPLDVYGYVRTHPYDLDEELEDATNIIDTATATSPLTIITPPPGRAIDVRRTYLNTNSTGGEIYVRFKNSGKVISALYPAKFGFAIMPAVRVPGPVNDEVIIEWSGLDAGAKIVYLINYKLR